jgi:hypothetical protein
MDRLVCGARFDLGWAMVLAFTSCDEAGGGGERFGLVA